MENTNPPEVNSNATNVNGAGAPASQPVTPVVTPIVEPGTPPQKSRKKFIIIGGVILVIALAIFFGKSALFKGDIFEGVDTAEQCTKVGGIWQEKTSTCEKKPEEAEPAPLPTDSTACKEAGGFWYVDTCYETQSEVDGKQCEDKGGFWSESEQDCFESAEQLACAEAGKTWIRETNECFASAEEYQCLRVDGGNRYSVEESRCLFLCEDGTTEVADVSECPVPGGSELTPEQQARRQELEALLESEGSVTARKKIIAVMVSEELVSAEEATALSKKYLEEKAPEGGGVVPLTQEQVDDAIRQQTCTESGGLWNGETDQCDYAEPTNADECTAKAERLNEPDQWRWNGSNCYRLRTQAECEADGDLWNAEGQECRRGKATCARDGDVWNESAQRCDRGQAACERDGGTWDGTECRAVMTEAQCTAQGMGFNAERQDCLPTLAQIAEGCVSEVNGTWSAEQSVCFVAVAPANIAIDCASAGGQWHPETSGCYFAGIPEDAGDNDDDADDVPDDDDDNADDVPDDDDDNARGAGADGNNQGGNGNRDHDPEAGDDDDKKTEAELVEYYNARQREAARYASDLADRLNALNKELQDARDENARERKKQELAELDRQLEARRIALGVADAEDGSGAPDANEGASASGGGGSSSGGSSGGSQTTVRETGTREVAIDTVTDDTADRGSAPDFTCTEGFEYDAKLNACVQKGRTFIDVDKLVRDAAKSESLKSIATGVSEGTGSSTSGTNDGGTDTQSAGAGASGTGVQKSGGASTTGGAEVSTAGTGGSTSSANAGASATGTAKKSPSATTGQSAKTTALHGAFIQGETGPGLLLYPLAVIGANGLLYFRRRRKK